MISRLPGESLKKASYFVFELLLFANLGFENSLLR